MRRSGWRPPLFKDKHSTATTRKVIARQSLVWRKLSPGGIYFFAGGTVTGGVTASTGLAGAVGAASGFSF